MTSPFFVSHHRKTLWFCNVPGISLHGKMLVKQQSRVRFGQNHRIVLWYCLMPIFGTKTGCTHHRRVCTNIAIRSNNNVVIKISTIFVQWILETKKSPTKNFLHCGSQLEVILYLSHDKSIYKKSYILSWKIYPFNSPQITFCIAWWYESHYQKYCKIWSVQFTHTFTGTMESW